MRLIDRYFTVEFLKVFIFALLGFVVMFMTIKILDVLKIETKQDRIHVYLYLLYSIPEVVSFVIPGALLFGVCFSVAQFTVSREIIAIQSAGVSFYRAVLPAFLSGIIMSVVLFLFQSFVVTPANEAAGNELNLLKKDTAVMKNVIWQKNLRGREGYYFLYYLDIKNLSVIGGFNYLEVDQNGDPRRMFQAKRAEYIKETGKWKLLDVRILNLTKDLKSTEIETQNELHIAFPDDITFFINPSRDPMELNVLELIEEIERRKSRGFSYSQYEVQFYANIAFPFMCLIVCMVGVIVGGMGSLRSSGPLIRSILISVATMLLYTLVFNLGKNLGSSEVLPAAAAGFGPTGVFLVLAAVLIYVNRR